MVLLDSRYSPSLRRSAPSRPQFSAVNRERGSPSVNTSVTLVEANPGAISRVEGTGVGGLIQTAPGSGLGLRLTGDETVGVSEPGLSTGDDLVGSANVPFRDGRRKRRAGKDVAFSGGRRHPLPSQACLADDRGRDRLMLHEHEQRADVTSSCSKKAQTPADRRSRS